MKVASPTRLVSRILFALTLSGVLHAALPVETPRKKLRMAEAEPPRKTVKPELCIAPREY